jgi:hypothetical protein
MRKSLYHTNLYLYRFRTSFILHDLVLLYKPQLFTTVNSNKCNLTLHPFESGCSSTVSGTKPQETEYNTKAEEGCGK